MDKKQKNNPWGSLYIDFNWFNIYVPIPEWGTGNGLIINLQKNEQIMSERKGKDYKTIFSLLFPLKFGKIIEIFKNKNREDGSKWL